MAILSGFFNSVNGDRKYDTNDVSSLFTGIFADGVFKTVGNNFMVKASSGMEVTIDTGKAWFDKHFVENTALLPKTVDQSEVLLDRIDAYVIEIDDTEPVRAATITYIKGTPASKPQKPELVKTEKKTQYPIAYITVPHGATSITNANIEIMVGKSECPFAVGVIEGVDIDNLFVQWEAQFGEWMTNEQLLFAAWFETIKGILGEDEAAELLQLIQANQASIESINGSLPSTTKTITIQPTEWVDKKYTLNDPLITATSNQEWCLPVYNDSSDDAMFDAIDAARIRSGGQSAGKAIIKCQGDVPTIAIKLDVIFRGVK